mmetsp:Transcript_9116/g.24741  ORF Transcript_9116/g.24741 Transcript_9116/m.24741 type:complete len:146 (-) Transcript_9116:574-1011(-)
MYKVIHDIQRGFSTVPVCSYALVRPLLHFHIQQIHFAYLLPLLLNVPILTVSPLFPLPLDGSKLGGTAGHTSPTITMTWQHGIIAAQTPLPTAGSFTSTAPIIFGIYSTPLLRRAQRPSSYPMSAARLKSSMAEAQSFSTPSPSS